MLFSYALTIVPDHCAHMWCFRYPLYGAAGCCQVACLIRVQGDLKIGGKLKLCLKLWGRECAYLLDNYPSFSILACLRRPSGRSHIPRSQCVVLRLARSTTMVGAGEEFLWVHILYR